MENEIWIPIKNFEGHYEISNLGKVKSIGRSFIRNGSIVPVRKRIMKTYLNRGYPTLKLCKNGKTTHKKIHILIGQVFILNPNNLKFLNHKNGIKTDFSIENLEWCTSKENINHALEHGLMVRPKGEHAYTSKKLLDTNTGLIYMSIKDASDKLNIKLSTLRCYLSGHRTNKSTLIYA